MNNIIDAIISIHPDYAEAILAGEKTVELRRRIPNLQEGTRLWIYATRPIGAVLGSAMVQEVIEGTPEEIWNKCLHSIAIDQGKFDEYFSGTDRAVALVLVDVLRRRQIGIEELRQFSEGFHPPQVLKRLSPRNADWLSRQAKVLA